MAYVFFNSAPHIGAQRQEKVCECQNNLSVL